MSKTLAAFVLVVAASLPCALAPGAPPAAPRPAAAPPVRPDSPRPARGTMPASAPASRPALPQTPGFHHLLYTCTLNKRPRKLAYVLYLPKRYDPNRPCPMVVYLCGAGEKGNNHEGVYGNGPPLSLRADKALAAWAPFIVLAPQCPADVRWDTPGVPQLVLDMTEMARQSLAVDADRVYLTGLSMGGAGVWRTALIGKGQFAAIAPFCSIEVAPDKMPAAASGSTVWIICGGADGGYTQGSRKMFKALRDAKIDAFYTEVPGAQHGVWPPFYASRQFYEFLLLHARGQRPAATRPAAEKLLAIAYTPPNSADAQLAAPFAKFLPWWYLSNCGKQNAPGPKAEALGRKNVFVTVPLDRAVPCRLLYTTAIPRDKQTILKLAVAAHPQGRWELVVRADGNDLLTRTIVGKQFGRPATQPSSRPASQPSIRPASRPATASRSERPASRPASGPASQPSGLGSGQVASAPSPWVEVSVNLSNQAGDEVHLELVNRGTRSPHAEAYWGKVELTSRPLEFEKTFPLWSLAGCDLGGEAGPHEELAGRRNVFVTSPRDGNTPCRLWRTVSVPKNKLTTLRLLVAAPEQGAWRLIVKGNGRELAKEVIGADGEGKWGHHPVSEDGNRVASPFSASPSSAPFFASPSSPWREVRVDLTPFAGSDVRIEILNASAGSPRADAWWGAIELLSADVPLAPDTPRSLTMFLVVTGGLLLYGLFRLGRRAFGRPI